MSDQSRAPRPLIARYWKCLCPRDRRAAFLEHLERTGVAETRAVPGCLGHVVLEREPSGPAGHHALIEISLVTFWESMEAVKAYAGERPERAKLYPDDEDYGIISDLEVLHFTMLDRKLPAGYDPAR